MTQPTMAGMDHAKMNMGDNDQAPAAALPNEVNFPYGFPTPGPYRIFIQMKHGETVGDGRV